MNLIGPSLQIVIEGDTDLDLTFKWDRAMPVKVKDGPQVVNLSMLVSNPNDVVVPVPQITGTPSNAAVKRFEILNAVDVPANAVDFEVPVEVEVNGQHGQAVTVSNIRIQEPLSA